jgi:hypothetical protein
MNPILETIINIVISSSKPALKAWIQDQVNQHGTKVKSYIASFYPQLDTTIEDLVANTGTQIDDQVVAKLKEVLEEIAAENGFTLSNVDGD